MQLSFLSLVIAIGAVSLVLFRIKPVSMDVTGVLVCTLSILVTLIVCWNMMTYIDIVKKVKLFENKLNLHNKIFSNIQNDTVDDMEECHSSKIENIVWHEYIQAKSWEQYISEYIIHKQDWKKYYSIATIIFSLIGSTSWTIWKIFDVEFMDNYITLPMFLASGISQIISAIQTKIVINNDAFKALLKLRNLYIAYYNKLELLNVDIHDNNISQDEIKTRFFTLRESVYPIEEIKDSLNIKDLKKLNKKIVKRMKDFVKIRWEAKYEEDN